MSVFVVECRTTVETMTPYETLLASDLVELEAFIPKEQACSSFHCRATPAGCVLVEWNDDVYQDMSCRQSRWEIVVSCIKRPFVGMI